MIKPNRSVTPPHGWIAVVDKPRHTHWPGYSCGLVRHSIWDNCLRPPILITSAKAPKPKRLVRHVPPPGPLGRSSVTNQSVSGINGANFSSWVPIAGTGNKFHCVTHPTITPPEKRTIDGAATHTSWETEPTRLPPLAITSPQILAEYINVKHTLSTTKPVSLLEPPPEINPLMMASFLKNPLKYLSPQRLHNLPPTRTGCLGEGALLPAQPSPLWVENPPWISTPTCKKRQLFRKACANKWQNLKIGSLAPRAIVKSPNWESVLKATTFFVSDSTTAPRPATRLVISPTANKKHKDTLLRSVKYRSIKYTPAVTSVLLWTKDDTGVGALMANGNHPTNGTWALFVHPPTKRNIWGATDKASVRRSSPPPAREAPKKKNTQASPIRLVIRVTRAPPRALQLP